MDTKALKLCASFSRQPNHLGYCGRPSAVTAFKNCLLNNQCATVPSEIEKFIVLNPYLKTIADVTGRPKLSYDVVEAFWFGNDLVKQFRVDHYSLLLDNLMAQGVPDVLIREAEANPPQTFIPIHLFNIVHIGVGRASGSVPFTLHSINQCMVRWGTVTRLLSQNQAQIDLNRLDSNFKLRSYSEKITYDPQFISKLRIGKKVAVHWGEIALILTNRQTSQLAFWTNQFLESEKLPRLAA